LILITDNQRPAGIDSERMLVAIRISDAEAVKLAVRKAMEVEPDASQMDVLSGVEIWQVQRGETTDDFEAELFGGELNFEEDLSDEQTPPLLDRWAIALVEKGSGSDAAYLMFSSHPDLLVDTARRIQEGAGGGFGHDAGAEKVVAAMKSLGASDVAYDRLVRTRIALRVKYELLRQGKLRDSDSVLAKLIRRLVEEEDATEPEPINAGTLPPLEEIEQHFPDGGGFLETTDDGWKMTGFLLK
jgi:hypothetical protein